VTQSAHPLDAAAGTANHRSTMSHAIYVLGFEIDELSQWMTDPESDDYARIKSKVDEVNEAIAILKQHSKETPCTTSCIY
jgi:Ni,Fe-hydrogenase III large subunit